MNRPTLFIRGLVQNTDEEALKYFFEKYGNVIKLKIIKDKDTKISKGFGFVTFSTTLEALKVKNKKSLEFKGNIIYVDWSNDSGMKNIIKEMYQDDNCIIPGYYDKYLNKYLAFPIRWPVYCNSQKLTLPSNRSSIIPIQQDSITSSPLYVPLESLNNYILKKNPCKYHQLLLNHGIIGQKSDFEEVENCFYPINDSEEKKNFRQIQENTL